MNVRTLTYLTLLGMIWGSSFLFQRITVPVLGVATTAVGRIVLAAVVLFVVALASGRRLNLRARWRDYLLVGMIGSGFPFLLFAFAAHSLPAGALEQAHAERGLERVDLVADRAVGQVQLVGGARVVLVASRGLEHAERTQRRQAVPGVHGRGAGGGSCSSDMVTSHESRKAGLRSSVDPDLAPKL